ncbi:hypothetical protein ZHAS_00016051 [Anopheles sinensis]|uniref:Uncharacterized protein n=1 Tax=Anopheles sinensis TaxID=74873 RepID=A0A084WCN4_ANOSI|nr:hypothetical protein ZHAS_00016051 [Anopheles sinensis]
MENTRDEMTRSYAGSEESESAASSLRAKPRIVDRELELARKRFALERLVFEFDISQRELELEELAIAIDKGTVQREPAKFYTAPGDQQAEIAMAQGQPSSQCTAPDYISTTYFAPGVQ